MGSGNASTSATGSPTCWPRLAREHPASTRPREIAPIFGLCPTLTGHALRTGSCFLRCRRNPLRVPSACLFPRPAPAHTRPVLTSSLRAGSAADCARLAADLARAPRPQGWSVRSRVASRVYRSTGSAVRCVSPWWDARSFDADRSRQRSNRRNQPRELSGCDDDNPLVIRTSPPRATVRAAGAAPGRAGYRGPWRR